ncbi:MAG: dephospho-CoA kinase [Clostridia bacterium]|nr:dephospho-CoA kinase [Clostridia bacterium]
MRVIGLTGGIACGKSTVSSSLRGMGLCVIDGDELSRRLTAPGGAALPAIREAFGPEVFLPDGQLNRRELGRRVFGHPEALAALDTLMEPPLFELIHAELAAARARGEALAVLDMPLLYEKGLDRLCDTVWCVSVPEEVQIRRLAERDGFSREEALARIRSQMPTAEKAARADLVIDTDHPIGYTDSMLPGLVARELEREEHPHAATD